MDGITSWGNNYRCLTGNTQEVTDALMSNAETGRISNGANRYDGFMVRAYENSWRSWFS